MSLYERSIAAGIPREVAMRDQHADEILRFSVRDSYANSAEYAMGERPQEPIANYADRRGI